MDKSIEPNPLIRRAWLSFLLIALWINLESIILGPYSYVPVSEFGECIFSLSMLISSDPWGPGLHYWLPSIACGVDRLANTVVHPQPLTLLTRFFPGWVALQLYLLIYYFLPGYFTHRLCADYLKMSPRAGIFAGAAMACSSGLTGGLGNVTLPLLLWSMEKLLDEGWARGLLGAALVGFLYSLGASAVVSMPFTYTWGLAWFWLVRGRLSFRFLTLYSVMIAASIPIHVQELWAMLLQAPLSHRNQWTPAMDCGVVGWAKPMAEAVRLLFENFTPVTAFAFLGLGAARFRPGRFGRVWAMLALTVAGAGLAPWIKGCMGESAGVLKGVHLHRFHLIYPLAAALCGGVGIELLGARKWPFPTAMALILAPLIYVKSKSIPDYLLYGGYTNLFKSPPIEELARKKDPSDPFRVTTFTHRLLPGFAHAYGLETVDGYINLYAGSYKKYWSKVIGPVMKRETWLEDYFGGWGSQVYLYLRSVYEWPDGVKFADHYRLPLLSLANAKYVISRHPLEDPNFKLLTPQTPWHKIHPKKLIKMRIAEEFHGKSYLFIYENTSALPRAFLVPAVRPFASADELWTALAAASVEDFKKAVFVEAAAGPGKLRAAGFRQGRITRALHGADRVSLSLKVDGPGVLVVSNNQNPYWKCRVDGKERPIFPAYGTFWGVTVDKGDQAVEFTYEPPYRLTRP